MIGIITSDVVGSRVLDSQDIWIKPLKKLFKTWELSKSAWSIYRGDSFQIRIEQPEEALMKAIHIKALMKSLSTGEKHKRSSILDVRQAIGIGLRGHQSQVVTESTGEAYIFSGELFEQLKSNKTTLACKTPWMDFDEEMNLMIRLALIAMDNWTINAGALMDTILKNKFKTQEEIGAILKIEQHSVSGRIKRAHIDEIFALDQMYRKKINQLLK